MSTAATVKEAVKETLVGSVEPEQYSAQTKARFNRFAVKDAETGDLVLGPDEFINAIAPPQEDYVSGFFCCPRDGLGFFCVTLFSRKEREGKKENRKWRVRERTWTS